MIFRFTGVEIIEAATKRLELYNAKIAKLEASKAKTEAQEDDLIKRKKEYFEKAEAFLNKPFIIRLLLKAPERPDWFFEETNIVTSKYITESVISYHNSKTAMLENIIRLTRPGDTYELTKEEAGDIGL